MDINPLYLMFPVSLSSSMGYMLPPSGPGVPMTLAAGARWVSVKDSVSDIDICVTDTKGAYMLT